MGNIYEKIANAHQLLADLYAEVAFNTEKILQENMPQLDEDFMSVQAAAKYLDCSVGHIKNICENLLKQNPNRIDVSNAKTGTTDFYRIKPSALHFYNKVKEQIHDEGKVFNDRNGKQKREREKKELEKNKPPTGTGKKG